MLRGVNANLTWSIGKHNTRRWATTLGLFADDTGVIFEGAFLRLRCVCGKKLLLLCHETLYSLWGGGFGLAACYSECC